MPFESRRSDLRLYLFGQTSSVFGSTLTATATSVVAVTLLHAGPSQVSFIVASATLPALLFGPLIGVLADRVRRPRRTLIVIDLVAAATMFGCAATAAAGWLSILILCGTAFTLGLSQVLSSGLYFAHLRNLVVGDLSQARGKLQMSELISRSVGSGVAGPLVAALGAALLFFVDGLSYLVSASALFVLRSPDGRAVAVGPRQGIMREMREGLEVIRRNNLLVAFTIYTVLVNVATSGANAQRAVFLLNTLRLPVALYSLPAVVAALLAAAGTWAGSRSLSRRLTSRQLMMICLPAIAVSGLTFPAAQGPLWLAVVMVMIGTGLPMFFGAASNLALIGVMSDDIGDEFFGRVGAILGSAATFANTGGALLGGVAGETFGVRGGLWMSQILIFLAGIVFLLWVRRGRRNDSGLIGEISPVTTGV